MEKETKKTKGHVAIVPSTPAMPQTSPEMLIAQAIDKGIPVETMERLLAMRREIRAERAKEVFDGAMAAFQAQCPVIKKTKAVRTKAGARAYSYAPIESIVEQVKPLLNRHGFSYAVETSTGDKKVKAICIAKHVGGHSESSSIEVPLGNKTDIMSDTQVVAAALTFAKRYAFCNAFGILTGDEDTDSTHPVSSKGQKPTELQAFEKMKTAIAAGKGKAFLEDVKARLGGSDLYTQAHKHQLLKLIDDKLASLKP